MRKTVTEKILSFLKNNPNSGQEQIYNMIRGNKQYFNRQLQDLLESGKVVQEQDFPYRYSLCQTSSLSIGAITTDPLERLEEFCLLLIDAFYSTTQQNLLTAKNWRGLFDLFLAGNITRVLELCYSCQVELDIKPVDYDYPQSVPQNVRNLLAIAMTKVLKSFTQTCTYEKLISSLLFVFYCPFSFTREDFLLFTGGGSEQSTLWGSLSNEDIITFSTVRGTYTCAYNLIYQPYIKGDIDKLYRICQSVRRTNMVQAPFLDERCLQDLFLLYLEQGSARKSSVDELRENFKYSSYYPLIGANKSFTDYLELLCLRNLVTHKHIQNKNFLDLKSIGKLLPYSKKQTITQSSFEEFEREENAEEATETLLEIIDRIVAHDVREKTLDLVERCQQLERENLNLAKIVDSLQSELLRRDNQSCQQDEQLVTYGEG